MELQPEQSPQMQQQRMQWTESDFDTMSWHDNHVHGIRVEQDNPEHGTGILALDLDYILEWLRGDDGAHRLDHVR
jgi:hypothetical protein